MEYAKSLLSSSILSALVLFLASSLLAERCIEQLEQATSEQYTHPLPLQSNTGSLSEKDKVYIPGSFF